LEKYFLTTKTNKIMKNLHIIPTDKPSRTYKVNSIGKLDWSEGYLQQVDGATNQNIYITNDELPKLDEWVLSFLEDESYGTPFKIEENHFNCGFDFKEDFKKVILTTYQDLIKDGVQAIDDEFLEWFVKNPSCEEIDYWKYMSGEYSTMTKEEPKQETLEEAADLSPVMPRPYITRSMFDEAVEEATASYSSDGSSCNPIFSTARFASAASEFEIVYGLGIKY
jgi:hypothetical protein